MFVIDFCSYAVQEKLRAFYTGGTVRMSSDGRHMFCSCGSAVNVVLLSSLAVVQTLEEVSLREIQRGEMECLWVQEEDTVVSLAVSPDDATVAVGWRSLLVRQYQWESGPNPSRQWKVLQLVVPITV